MRFSDALYRILFCAGENAKEKRAAADARKIDCAAKLKSGEYVNTRVSGSSSKAWEIFARVKVAATGKDTEFVQCLNAECGLIKICSPNSGSRKSLAEHVCKPRPAPPKPGLPRNVKSNLAELLAELTGETFAPFNLCESDAFQKIVSYCLEVGHVHGADVNVEEIIPSSKTVAEKVQAKADKAREDLLQEAKPAIENGRASGTVDGWTDSQRHRKYLAHTVAYIDEEWRLQDHILSLPHCNAESVTSEVISDTLNMSKVQLDINPQSKVHYTTDDGADIVCAVRLMEQERSYCMDHCSNLIVKKAMEAKLTTIDLYGVLGGPVVDKVAEAVRIVLRCNQKEAYPLKSKLKRGPVSRSGQRVYKSSIPMLKAAKLHFPKITNVLAHLGKESVLTGVSAKDIDDIIGVVTPIEALANTKGAKNVFVACHEGKLKELTTIKTEDSPLKVAVKGHISEQLGIMPLLVLIQKLKGVVKYMKSSGLNEQLQGGTLKQEVDTRWMSVLHMINSFFPPAKSPLPVHCKIDQINGLLRDRGRESQVISDEDIVIMESIIPILSSFEKAIKEFEGEYVPTIQHVVPQFFLLKEILQPKVNDIELVKKFKALLLKQLEAKYKTNITMRHKIGMLLWPQFKTLSKLSEEEKKEVSRVQISIATFFCFKRWGTGQSVHEAVRSIMEEQKNANSEGTPAAEDEEVGAEPPDKRRRVSTSSSDDDYALLQDSVPEVEHDDELDRYLKLHPSHCKAKSKELLNWWKTKVCVLRRKLSISFLQAKDFPLLSVVAKIILATPASSASAERKFSAAGLLITSRKNALLPQTIEDLVVYHDYLIKKKKEKNNLL
ncbi:uncharacterized protein LOC117647737 [Thrips palmi]|uniref:Uncharacterized protein LOC117647737 n=1 Tax=Thrips palmi TaxID=161013 RepID=A0A6P8Z5X5_THRPL|nr:uncharacterized protein LOC117647737 [Thrips palmi]